MIYSHMVLCEEQLKLYKMKITKKLRSYDPQVNEIFKRLLPTILPSLTILF